VHQEKKIHPSKNTMRAHDSVNQHLRKSDYALEVNKQGKRLVPDFKLDYFNRVQAEDQRDHRAGQRDEDADGQVSFLKGLPARLVTPCLLDHRDATTENTLHQNHHKGERVHAAGPQKCRDVEKGLCFIFFERVVVKKQKERENLNKRRRTERTAPEMHSSCEGSGMLVNHVAEPPSMMSDMYMTNYAPIKTEPKSGGTHMVALPS